MITPTDIERVTMSPEKRKEAKNDFFAFYIGRPITYVLTIPFLYTRISPNAVTYLSILPSLIGLYLAYIGESTCTFVWSWFCFFMWSMLDGVDGNIARYKKQFSKMGSVIDAMAGYVTMVLIYLAYGIAASHHSGWFQNVIHIPLDLYVIMGGLSGVFVIFPRFIMHKAMTTLGNSYNEDNVKNKSGFNFPKLIALNLTSIAGFVQVFLLIAAITNTMDLFTVFYFFINFFVMLYALYTILR